MKIKKISCLILISLAIGLSQPILFKNSQRLLAQNQTDCSQVTLAFDDGLESVYSLAAPALKAHGFPATAYVYTQAQNEEYDGYLAWTEVVSLQNNFGWEIGSHGYSHDNLTEISLAAAKNELERVKNDLISHNIKVESFASPFGAYNYQVLKYAAGLYASHRTAWSGLNNQPAEAYYLKAVAADDLSLDQIKGLVNQAKQTNGWLILYFHGLTEDPTVPKGYFYQFNDFQQILDYLKNQNSKVVTVSAGLSAVCPASTYGPNRVVNGDFEDNLNFNSAELTWYSPLDDQESIEKAPWGHSAEVVGDVSFVAGRNGNAVSFTDLSWSPDYIALPAYQVINPKQGAVVFWYQPNYDHTENVEARFFEADADCCEFEFNHDPAGFLYFKIEALKNNAIIVPVSNYSWHKGEWVKLEVRWHESDYMAVYVNDQQVGLLGRDNTGKIYGRLPDFTDHYLGSVLAIGSAGSRGKINGAMDDFMIFKSADYQLPSDAHQADFWTKNPKTEVKITNTSSGRTAQIIGGADQKMIATFGIPVQPGNTYELSAAFKVTGYSAGDASVWVAEFDQNYHYLGGQWLGGFTYDFIGRRYFRYTPNPNVNLAEIYFLTHENAKMTMNIDDVELKKIQQP